MSALFDAKWLPPPMVRHGGEKGTYEGRTKDPSNCISKGRRYLMTADANGLLCLFSVEPNTLGVCCERVLDWRDDAVYSYTFFDYVMTEDGLWVAACRDDGYIDLCRVAYGGVCRDSGVALACGVLADEDGLRTRWLAHDGEIWMVRFHRLHPLETERGKVILLSGSDDGCFCAWDLSEFVRERARDPAFPECVFRSKQGHTAGVTSLFGWHCFGSFFLTGSYDGSVSVWRLDECGDRMCIVRLWTVSLGVGSIWRLQCPMAATFSCSTSPHRLPCLRLGVAGMYEGASVVDLDIEERSFRVVWQFRHASMVYGLDVLRIDASVSCSRPSCCHSWCLQEGEREHAHGIRAARVSGDATHGADTVCGPFGRCDRCSHVCTCDCSWSERWILGMCSFYDCRLSFHKLKCLPGR
jgi:hypothetical protein